VVDDFASVYIIYVNQQVSLATILWEQGKRSMYPPSPSLCWLDPWLLISVLFPWFTWLDGLPFDFQQGIWFPQNGPKRTKDSAFSAELQQALAMMEDLIKSCELAVDLAAVTGCPDDIRKLGKLLMHGSFNVWTVHKDRYKMKDFIRFKPSQRQIYLFERGIVFCKIRMEPSDQGLAPHYSFKKSMKLMTLSIRQLGRGSSRKFEIANRNGLEKYILQAASKEIRDCWFSEISKLLLEQQNNNKAKTLEWNLYPGLKIWKELPAVRKTQSPAYMGLKIFMRVKTMANKSPPNAAPAESLSPWQPLRSLKVQKKWKRRAVL